MMPWSHKRVLVADDSETMRMFILFHLIKTLPGVQIIEAVNGLDAIEKLKDQDVDLILTDMNMPELDGGRDHPRCEKYPQQEDADHYYYYQGRAKGP